MSTLESAETSQAQNEEFTDYLFELTMEQKWGELAKIYADNSRSWARTAKLTNAKETALHVAVSSYRPDHPRRINYSHIKKMIESVPADELINMRTDKGNTVLHLAAAVGWRSLCHFIAERDSTLLEARNHMRETPLFVAALYGNLKTFVCLHEIHSARNKDDAKKYYSVCRRIDGTTILHTAIAYEHLELAYQIILYYEELMVAVNEEGERPLYVLATKPNVFEGKHELGFYDKIIYYCVHTEEFKKHKCVLGAKDDIASDEGGSMYPENYQTCASILKLFWTPISKSFEAGWKNMCKNSNDEENQHTNKKISQGTFPQDEGKSNARYYPANYTTCILFFKFVMKVILTVLGVGFYRIKYIREKKQRYVYATKIMNKLIEYESSNYKLKYANDGQEPDKQDIPQRPDDVDFLEFLPYDHDQHTNEEENEGNKQTNGDEKEWRKVVKKDAPLVAAAAKIGVTEAVTKILEALPTARQEIDNKKRKRVKKDTSMLTAAKMGIPEIVKKILKTFPIAIKDLDSNGKNVLMLAAENRHTRVFKYLLNSKLPQYVFQQVDNNQNSILHLAAMLGELHPWRLPGAALQMQWEIKWYEYVKRAIPRASYAHSNKDGETAWKIFTKTHRALVGEGTEWLVKTSESCSLVAALVATVAFATAATVPGGLNQNSGHPIMEKRTAFDIFSISSLIALCLSVTALVFFLAIITSRCQDRDFKSKLPNKLLMGLTALFASIVAMLVSFCAGHTFILRSDMRIAAVPIYTIACVPVTLFALAQLPLYFDLAYAICVDEPQRSYNAYHH